jgi:hypothetical protein
MVRSTPRFYHLPSDNVSFRPHGPLEQFLDRGFADSTGPADEYGYKVLDAVALRIAGAQGFV